jgi:hypothetical protein
MTFTRRGFLGLAAGAVAEAVAQRIIPARPVPIVAPAPALRVRPDQIEIARFVMPFAPEIGFVEIVEPGAVVSFVARSQILFRPDRLIFSACDPRSFELLPFVGSDGEPDMLEPVPLEAFDSRNFGQRLELGAVRPGDEIVLTMRNISKGEREVRGAAMIGLRAS